MLSLLEILAQSVYLLLLLGLYLSFKEKKHFKYIFSIILTYALSQSLKFVFKIPRPISEFEGYSFPSNHASVSFSACYYLPKYFYIWAILVSLVRILQGAHRIEDIVFGWLLGILISYTIDKTKVNYQIILRKIVHIVVIFVHYLLFLYFGKFVLILILFELALFPILSEKSKVLNKIKLKLKYPWECEIYPLGVLTILLGLLIIFTFSQENLPLILVLAISDSLSILGNLEIKILKKPMFGILLGSLTTFIIYSLFYNISLGVIAALLFLLAELTPVDNLLIPLVLLLIFS